jgi:hypothetical protein
MENKMKKLIALFAVSSTAVLASTAAVGSVALSGSASVSYDDNGTSASSTTYDADMTIVGTAGGTTLTASYDMDGSSMATTAVDLSTTIGPVTIAADMFDEVSGEMGSTFATSTTWNSGTTANGTAGQQIFEKSDTGVTVSLDVPVGDATVALDNSGNVILSGSWSGVSLTHTVGDTTVTTAGVALAGVDVNVTNSAGATTWDLATTVSGIDLTLASTQKVTAAFGLAGNTMTVSSIPAVASSTGSAGTFNGTGTSGYGTRSTTSVASYSTVAISRDLTSGASLTATYSTKDDSLTLKAAVTF